MSQLRPNNIDNMRPLDKILESNITPNVSASRIKRQAYYIAVFIAALGAMAAAEPLRRAEPFIGSRIADMFIFSVLKNNNERFVPTFAWVHAQKRVRFDVADQL